MHPPHELLGFIKPRAAPIAFLRGTSRTSFFENRPNSRDSALFEHSSRENDRYYYRGYDISMKPGLSLEKQFKHKYLRVRNTRIRAEQVSDARARARDKLADHRRSLINIVSRSQFVTTICQLSFLTFIQLTVFIVFICFFSE